MDWLLYLWLGALYIAIGMFVSYLFAEDRSDGLEVFLLMPFWPILAALGLLALPVMGFMRAWNWLQSEKKF